MENNMDYQIGNEVIAKSNDVDITCMGKIQGTVIDDGNIYYVVCNSLFLADELAHNYKIDTNKGIGEKDA